MGDLMGSMQNSSSPLNPTAGVTNQNNYIQALMNSTMAQKPDGSYGFQGVQGYGGQMAVDPSQTMLGSVDSSWNPNLSGTLQAASQNLMGGGNAAVNGVQNATSGWATPAMGNLSTYGAAGPGGSASSNMGQGIANGNSLSFLSPYMGGQSADNPTLMPSHQGTPMGSGGAGNVPSGAMNPYAGMQGFGGMNAGLANQPGAGNMYNQQMSPSSALGSLSGNMGYLNNIAAGGGAGAPVNQTPAWQSMVNAQQQNITTGADQLKESMNSGGGLFSSAYGSAAGLYQDQARLGQNAQLTQASTAAMQQANQNQLGASQQLSSQGYGALGSLYGGGLSSAQLGAQLGSQNAINSANNSAQATNNMYSTESAASLYGVGQGMSGLGAAGNMSIQNSLAGGQLGGQQAGLQQNQLTSNFNNWYMQQAQNNPLLSQLYGQMNSTPAQTQQTYVPGALGSILGLGGTLAGGIGSAGGLGAFFSDRRLKENIQKVGRINDINLYSYNYKGLPGRQVGVIAQQLHRNHPEAVIKGNRTSPWMVKRDALTQLLTA